MQLKVEGELLVFYQLIEAMRKEIADIDRAEPMEAELADEVDHGNFLYFGQKALRRFVRVSFALWSKDRFCFTLVSRFDGYREERCIFPVDQLDQGVRAAAVFIKEMLINSSDENFEYYFQKEKEGR